MSSSEGPESPSESSWVSWRSQKISGIPGPLGLGLRVHRFSYDSIFIQKASKDVG